MFEELLSQQNPHWSDEAYEIGIERTSFPLLLEYLQTKQIIAITGVRRSGKSTLIRYLIDHLIQVEKVQPNQILFCNLEHPFLTSYRNDSMSLQLLYDEYLKMNQPEGDVFVFLDEVQFFREWPVFVKAHHETKKVRFVVTGSNAAMLSSDMITLLSGRSLPLEIFPLSLRELARAKKINTQNAISLAKNAPQIQLLLDEMLQYGGYPTVALQKLGKTSFDILGAHARTVLLQDVAPRLGARKPADLEKLYVYLVSNISKLFSYANLSKLFGISDKSTKEYIEAFSNAYLLYEVDLFDYSLKKQIRSQKKIYAIDTGQANAMGFKFSSNRGRLLENLLFIELKRLGLDVYYYKTAQGEEVDFVVQQGSDICLMQITWSVNDPQTRERELKALTVAMKELKCKRGILILQEPLLGVEIEDQEIDVILAHQFITMDPTKQGELLFQS